MTIPEIERAEAGIEVKAAAVSNLLPPVHRQAFELTLDGVLGNGSYEDQKQAAYNWMCANYALTAAVIYATMNLSEEVYAGICDFGWGVGKLEKGAD